MFEGDFADPCTEKFPLVSMGNKLICKACADGEGELDYLFGEMIEMEKLYKIIFPLK